MVLELEKAGFIDVIAERPVAVNSPDHVQPWGTRRDNSQNRHFDAKLVSCFMKKIIRARARFGLFWGWICQELH